MTDPAVVDVPAGPTRNEHAKLLVWHGIKSKDTFLPLQQIEIVETTKVPVIRQTGTQWHLFTWPL
jgi:hypothetical protein